MTYGEDLLEMLLSFQLGQTFHESILELLKLVREETEQQNLTLTQFLARTFENLVSTAEECELTDQQLENAAHCTAALLRFVEANPE